MSDVFAGRRQFSLTWEPLKLPTFSRRRIRCNRDVRFTED